MSKYDGGEISPLFDAVLDEMKKDTNEAARSLVELLTTVAEAMREKKVSVTLNGGFMVVGRDLEFHFQMDVVRVGVLPVLKVYDVSTDPRKDMFLEYSFDTGVWKGVGGRSAVTSITEYIAVFVSFGKPKIATNTNAV